MKNYKLIALLFITHTIFSQNNVPPSGSVNFDTNLKIGKQEAAANTAGEIVRLSLNPYGHTAGPWNFKARDISGTAYLDIDYGLSGSVITFGSDKNVGIGTITPLAKLEVKGGNILVRNSANVDNESSIMIAHSIGLGSYTTFGTSIRTITQSSGYNTYGLQFFTQELYSTGQTEKMRILGNGNVGINSLSPLNKFEVKVPTSTGSSGVDGVAVHDGATNRMAVNLGINTVGEYSWIQSSKGGVGFKNLLINPNGGNVGIGTTSPVAKFHIVDVNGGVFFDGANAAYNRFKSTDIAPTVPKPLLISAQLSGTTPDIYVNTSGNVGIGTMNPAAKLTVAGDINSREVRVTVDAGADFVFENNYNLPSLDAVDKYIKENKHLPEIASADEMKKEGINLSEMNIKLLQKIEELTLYTIQQEKKNDQQSLEIEMLKKENETIKSILYRLSQIEQKLK
jgi:hypothetical protein